MSRARKNALIRRDHLELSISQQWRLMRLSQQALYWAPVETTTVTLELMRGIHRVFTTLPFFGNCQIAGYLCMEGFVAGHNRIRRLISKVGLVAICNRPGTSRPLRQHPVHPYLLGITLCVTRKVLSLRASISLHGDLCMNALKEARAFISTDGRGRCKDNIFIERFWRSLNREAVRLEELAKDLQALRVIRNWIAFYNARLPCCSFERRTPKEAYWARRDENLAA